MNPGVCVITNLLCCVKSKMSFFIMTYSSRCVLDKCSDSEKADAHALWHRLVELGDILQKIDDTNVKAMMTSSNENMFHVAGPLWGESTGHRWIPQHKGQ